LRIPISKRGGKALGDVENADKWSDAPGKSRSRAGTAYHTIIEGLVREIASGGRATVHHYVAVTSALIEAAAKQGVRLLITEGAVSSGRFDIAEIDFLRKKVILMDVTALLDQKHIEKNLGYAADLEKLTGFPVTTY